MRSTILAVVSGAALALSTLGAQAMPAGPVSVGAGPEVTLVANGCGIYRHMNARGFCVPNRAYGYYPGYYYRPYARCGLRVGPIGIGGPC